MKFPSRLSLAVLASLCALGCKAPEIPSQFDALVPAKYRDQIRELSVDKHVLQVFYDKDLEPTEIIAAYRSHLEGEGYVDMLECKTPDSGLDLLKAPNHEAIVTAWPLNLIKVTGAEVKGFSNPYPNECQFNDNAKTMCTDVRPTFCSLPES